MPPRAGAGGQRADHLAVQRLVVEPALTGDDQLGRGDVVGKAGVLGDDRRPGLAPAAQRQQAGAETAGGAGAGLVADVRTGQRRRARRPTPVSRRSSTRTVSGSAPFCGPNTAAAPIGPSSGCSTSVAAISSTPASSSLGRRRARRAPRSCPGRRRCRRCRPARRRSGSRRPRSAAAMSWPTPLLCAASAVSHGRRTAKQRQPAGLRALDVGRARLGVVEHPLGVDLVVQRPADTRRVRRSPSRLASTSTNPGPPSDCGARVSSSSGRDLRQPVGDGLGGLHRGQAVAVAVRARSARGRPSPAVAVMPAD